VLAVIGDDAPNALSGSGAGARAALERLSTELGLADNLRLLGPCDDETLSQAYSASDVHVFPVRETRGDVEGFGMVAIEAAAHGLPTVAFATGGIPDSVRHGLNGFLIRPGDYAGFAERVCELLAAGREAPIRASAREMAKDYTWDIFAARLRESLLPILGKKRIDTA
jgi:phosphatidylinositol alpha-1,6-mannosyltransferase